MQCERMDKVQPKAHRSDPPEARRLVGYISFIDSRRHTLGEYLLALSFEPRERSCIKSS